MKKITLLLLLAAYALPAREANLINNAAFSRGLTHWFHSGAGTAVKGPSGAELSGGAFAHYLDLGNLEHSDPRNLMPRGRIARFSIQAAGSGTFRLSVRTRLMRAGNALEFAERGSAPIRATADVQTHSFEFREDNPDAVMHDKLTIEPLPGTRLTIRSATFFYRERPDYAISFTPAAAAVRPHDRVTVKIHTSLPKRTLNCDFYPGQAQPGGYSGVVSSRIVTDGRGDAVFSFTVPWAVQDGVRLAVSDPENGVKESFMATVLPEKALAEMRASGKKLSGKKHILYLGDSLTDYDRGRNHVSLAQCFMPPDWTVRNAGVGGDTLVRIYDRLRGRRSFRPDMYKHLFTPAPDAVILLCGGNDTKVSFRSGYRENATPVPRQPELLRAILDFLARSCPGAAVILVTAPESYYPYQKSLAEPLARRGFNHNFFGLPEPIRSYNERLRKIAAERGLKVVDFAEAVRAAYDPQELYVPDDGVHLSLKGHRLLAGLVLACLAENDRR